MYIKQLLLWVLEVIRENIQTEFLDVGLGNEFLDMTLKSMSNKIKNKQGVHQT